MASECYRIGGVILNAGTQEVTRAGVAVPLPPLSFHLLLTLARKAPNVVTTRELEAEVWSGVVVDRGTINKRVVLVRNALREAGCVQDYIAVVRGTGYRLAVQVEQVDCDAMDTTAELEELVQEAPPEPEPGPAATRPLRWKWLGFALLFAAMAGLFTWQVRHGHDAPPTTRAPGSAGQARVTGDSVHAETMPGGKGASAETPAADVAITTNVPAYSLYLEGRALMDDRMNAGVDGLKAALAKFESAVERDQAFLQAHVGVAAVNFLLGNYDTAGDSDDYLARAETSARYALELQPTSADALGVLAAVMMSRGEASQAATLFERAYELGGRDTNVLHWHAMLYNSMGYFDPLVPMLEAAWKQDPLSPLMACSLAGTLNLGGHPEEAIQVLMGMPRFDRRDLLLGLASIYLEEYDAAREMLSGLPLRSGTLPEKFADLLVSAFEDPLRRETAESALVDAAHTGEMKDILAFEILLILGSPHAFDLEVDLAGTPFAHRLPEEVWSNWGVELRRDPRFKAWVQNLGYDRYWRKFGWPDRCKPTGRNDFECV